MRAVLLCLVSFVLAGCLQSEPVPQNLTAGELAVLKDFFESQVSDENGFVHLDAKTSVYESNGGLKKILRSMQSVSPTTIDNFIRMNTSPAILPSDHELGTGVRVDSDNEAGRLFGSDQDGWDLYYERYPNGLGLAAVSRVGINKQGTEALLYYGIQSDWLLGIGHFVFLRLESGKWVEVESVMAWVS